MECPFALLQVILLHSGRPIIHIIMQITVNNSFPPTHHDRLPLIDALTHDYSPCGLYVCITITNQCTDSKGLEVEEWVGRPGGRLGKPLDTDKCNHDVT